MASYKADKAICGQQHAYAENAYAVMPEEQLQRCTSADMATLLARVKTSCQVQRYLNKFSNLAEDIEVEPELMLGLRRLPLSPFSEAAFIPGHYQCCAITCDAKVMQLTHSWISSQALHDADLPESCCLQFVACYQYVYTCCYIAPSETLT